jgi:hypothetical protein
MLYTGVGYIKIELMQRLKRKNTIRRWAMFSLLALLVVFSSPAYAISCCCQSSAPTSSHPSLYGGDECCDEDVAASSAHSHEGHFQVQASAPHPGGLCVSDPCDCAHQVVTALAVVDSKNGSAFSPLVLGTIADRFLPSLTCDERIALFFASRALRPRAPDGALRSGRAPPAFIL